MYINDQEHPSLTPEPPLTRVPYPSVKNFIILVETPLIFKTMYFIFQLDTQYRWHMVMDENRFQLVYLL